MASGQSAMISTDSREFVRKSLQLDNCYGESASRESTCVMLMQRPTFPHVHYPPLMRERYEVVSFDNFDAEDLVRLA